MTKVEERFVASEIIVWMKNFPDDKTPIYHAWKHYNHLDYLDFIEVAKDLCKNNDVHSIISKVEFSTINGIIYENNININELKDEI